jgi:hypothetical protein
MATEIPLIQLATPAVIAEATAKYDQIGPQMDAVVAWGLAAEAGTASAAASATAAAASATASGGSAAGSAGSASAAASSATAAATSAASAAATVQDRLTAGQMVPNRDLLASAAVSHAAGTLALSFFTADKTETITRVTAYTGTVAAGATPTLCRYGIYEIDANGNGTLVASTANDTTLFAAANTAYPKLLTAAFQKVAGKRYATGLLVATAATMPTFHGPSSPTTAVMSTVALLAPMTIARLVSLADLPASFTAASLIGYQQRSHMLLN